MGAAEPHTEQALSRLQDRTRLGAEQLALVSGLVFPLPCDLCQGLLHASVGGVISQELGSRPVSD